MDESHLIARTAHVNTAGLPTALASIIGLASMHTCVDHGESRGLGARLQDCCRQGLDLPEAEHLCRRGKATIQVLVGGVILGIGWLTSCGDGHQAISLPPTLSYNGSQPFPAVVGQAIALTPAVTGSIDRYVVSPELPSGLVLNRQTGVISGTPTRASEAAAFAVTGTYRAGHRTYPLVLSVTEPPSHLSYLSPAMGTVGATLTPLRPKIVGSVEHYSVTPALPAGVVLDSASGLIAGTPGLARTLAPYTITASSQAGNTSFIFLFAVAAPSTGRDQPHTKASRLNRAVADPGSRELPENRKPSSRSFHAYGASCLTNEPHGHFATRGYSCWVHADYQLAWRSRASLERSLLRSRWP